MLFRSWPDSSTGGALHRHRRGQDLFRFPSSPNVSLDFVSGHLRTLGKTKLTVSFGTTHQVYIKGGPPQAEFYWITACLLDTKPGVKSI